MNTAEDIAKKHFPCTCGEIYLSRNLTAPDCPYHSLDWEAAMGEYARQISATVYDNCWYNTRDGWNGEIIPIVYMQGAELKIYEQEKLDAINDQLSPEKEEDYDLPTNWEPNYNTETPEERRDEAIKQQKLK